MPRTVADDLLREVPLLRIDEPVASAVETIVASGVSALPVVDERGEYRGILGEREFIGALFPGYLGTLKYAGFVPHSLDGEIERRSGCLAEEVGRHLNRDHVDVGEEYSDAELAEIFLHHRVLIVPVVDGERRVRGIVTRADFFRALAERARAL